MESSSSRTYTASDCSEMIRICNKDDEFKESDDEFTPCGDFKDVNGSETLFPSELLASSSIKFTHENRQPAVRDSLLNSDEDCIEEGNSHRESFLV